MSRNLFAKSCGKRVHGILVFAGKIHETFYSSYFDFLPVFHQTYKNFSTICYFQCKRGKINDFFSIVTVQSREKLGQTLKLYADCEQNQYVLHAKYLPMQ